MTSLPRPKVVDGVDATAAGGQPTRVTFGPSDYWPVWSPDGMRLAYGGSTNFGGGPRLTIRDLPANGAARDFASELPASEAQKISHFANLPTDWSRDGRFIAFDDGVGHEVQESVIVDLAGHNVALRLQNQFAQWGTAFSPDGSRIALVSVESGRPEVNVQAWDTTPSPHLVGERRQVSRNGAWLVRWRADGRELFYVGMDNFLYAVPVKGLLEFGDPEPLFRIAGVPQYGTARDFQFDVSPDGQRFIMPATGSVPPPPFTVIENWQDKFHH